MDLRWFHPDGRKAILFRRGRSYRFVILSTMQGSRKRTQEYSREYDGSERVLECTLRALGWKRDQ